MNMQHASCLPCAIVYGAVRPATYIPQVSCDGTVSELRFFGAMKGPNGGCYLGGGGVLRCNAFIRSTVARLLDQRLEFETPIEGVLKARLKACWRTRIGQFSFRMRFSK
jgi:hypothetical protein